MEEKPKDVRSSCRSPCWNSCEMVEDSVQQNPCQDLNQVPWHPLLTFIAP